MPGKMAPLKKSRNPPSLPLALNPLKSKEVLAVLAERNQSIVPVGAWVEPALPDSSEIPAHTSAYMIEEEIKEQLRKKEAALKHFQRQVKHRVNQQIRLRKKQQLQRSYEAAEKEGIIAMHSSDPAHLTPKRRTSVFPNSLNAAIVSSRLPPSQMLGDGVEDGENQNELFQQQAQALSQTMKQARHQLASFKTGTTLCRKPASIRVNVGIRGEFPLKVHQGHVTAIRYQNLEENQELDFGESLFIMTDDEGRDNLHLGEQENLLSEVNDKHFSRVQKVKFKNPLFAIMEEGELKRKVLQSSQNTLLEAQNYLPEVQGDLPETQDDLPGVYSVEPEAQSIEADTQAIELGFQAVEPDTQTVEPEAQAIEPEAQVVEPEAKAVELKAQAVEPEAQAVEPEAQVVEPEAKAVEPEAQAVELEVQAVLLGAQDVEPHTQTAETETQGVMLEARSMDLEDASITLEARDFLPLNQEKYFRWPSSALTTERWIEEPLTSAQQYLLPRFQGQASTRDELDQEAKERDQQEKANLKEPTSTLIGRRGREAFPLDVHQDLLHRHQDQASLRGKDVFPRQPSYFMRGERVREEFPLEYCHYVTPKIQDQASSREKQDMFPKQPSSLMREERVREELPLEYYQHVTPKTQDQTFSRDQILYFKQQPSVGRAERWQEDLLLDGHQHLPPRHQGEASSRSQVYDEYQSGLNTELQAPVVLQSGVDEEEDKKERQKQYLRYRRLFMDIEREQVKEQQRQKEHKKKIEKIKKKKEQQRYAEEQRILRMTLHDDLNSREKLSERLAQLQLEEIKGAREKQQQKEKEYLRYVDALRAQIQEKMQLYNITLPPLCCCGPDFWDAHPDTCANNCIFYRNHRAYTRALHSVINSCDIPEGNSALRTIIHYFASVHGRSLKNL
ncbi:coiled-coil domain-containing protein 15 isoform X3 [Dasypus novemcinctus]|uniref:coiled-coil domain-containing protein 15 isoform X3 n=1 Tax=Dasypus novemcinctus TaxID=9361 RepID=UPI00265F71A2|nr:coiled-coil domain-containing protein 15 isoform X3 [Dasypus novemcinctus]